MCRKTPHGLLNNTPRLHLSSAWEIKSGQFVFYPLASKKEPKWEDIKGNKAACKQYIQEYPEGKWVEEAYFEIATLSKEITDYKTYVQKFRRGKFTFQGPGSD